MIKHLILNGIYPTHPLWEWLPLILAFEIAVIAIEAMIVYVLYGLIERKEGAFRAIYLCLFVAISNIISFTIGLTIQILMAWEI